LYNEIKNNPLINLKSYQIKRVLWIYRIFLAHIFFRFFWLSALFTWESGSGLFFTQYREKTSRKKNPKSRFLRRGIGSLMVIIVGLLLHYGITRLPAPTQDNYTNQLVYWSIVSGLVFFIFILALWDAYTGVRNIEKTMDHSTEKYIRQIRESIKK
jgi:phosphatidylglycerophosphate synthase